MKSLKLFFLTLILIAPVFAQYPDSLYCNAKGLMGAPIGGIYGYNDWFTNVTFAGINNSSIKGGWITLYPSTHGAVQQGKSYTLSVTVNSAGADFSFQYIAAYIDWNRDGDCGTRTGTEILDTGEGYVLGYGASHTATMTYNITVPNDAAIGTTWLRVMLDADEGSSTGGSYGCYVGYGEIKDFPIDVSVATSVELTSLDVPTAFALNQNFPNPFNPSTSIAFGIPERSQVTLKIYDLLGKEAATLLNDETVSAGNHTKQWNAANMPSGVYFYKLQAGTFTATKKLVLMK